MMKEISKRRKFNGNILIRFCILKDQKQSPCTQFSNSYLTKFSICFYIQMPNYIAHLNSDYSFMSFSISIEYFVFYHNQRLIK